MTIKQRRTRRERELSRLIKNTMTKPLSLKFNPIVLTQLVDDNDVQMCPETIQFWGRLFLEKEHRELMQAHFGLTDEEREEKKHEYSVTLLSKIAVKAPLGIPGFPKEFDPKTDDLEKAVHDALIEKTEVNETIAELLIGEHLASGGNRYFFR
jgi:hypothetical protein